MKYYLILLLLILLACKDNVHKSGFLKKETRADNEKLTLQVISKLPDTIYGCQDICSIENTESSEIGSQIIYASNITELAFIKINGELIQLAKDTINSNFSPKINAGRDIFLGGHYKSVLDFEGIELPDETFKYSGNLKIFRNDTLKINIKVNGMSGC